MICSTADGKPPTTKTDIADHGPACHGMIEMGRAPGADGVAKDYGDRASARRPPPMIQNIMPGHQLTSQLAAAKRGRQGGPDQLADDMSRADRPGRGGALSTPCIGQDPDGEHRAHRRQGR
eukprot:1323905-Pyramimonas_sp.AAC.1